MNVPECPVPNKRLKIMSTSSNEYSSENEIWKLSDDFEIFDNSSIVSDNKILSIDDEVLKSVNEINYSNLFNIQKKISDSLKQIYEASSQKSHLYLCRCDKYLNKMIYKSHKSRIEYVQTMTRNIREYFPKLSQLNEAMESVTCQMIDVDRSIILRDILDDIDDLKLWIMDTNRKMNLMLMQGNWNASLDIIWTIKGDIKVHDRIRNTINRVIEEVFESNSVEDGENDGFDENIQSMKSSLIITEEQFFQLWIQIMELEEQFKQALPLSSQCAVNNEQSSPLMSYCKELSGEANQLFKSSNLAYGDCESGIETEFSPRFPWKRRHSSLLLPWNQKTHNQYSKNLLETKIRYTNISGSELNESVSEDVIPETEESMDQFYQRDDQQFADNITNKLKRKMIRRRRKRKKDAISDGYGIRNVSRDLFSSTDENNEDRTDGNNTIRAVRSNNKKSSPEHNFTGISPDISAALERGGFGYTEVAEVTDQMIKSQFHSFPDSDTNRMIETPPNDNNDNEVLVSNDIIYEAERAGVIDIKQHWDYYEAPLYSHTDGGDSELLDVSEIREWEHDLDDNSSDLISPVDSWNEEDKRKCDEPDTNTDDVNRLNADDLDENIGSANSVDGRKDILTPQNENIQHVSLMMTSGYETSLEPLSQNHSLPIAERSNTNYLLTVILTSSTNQLNESTEALKCGTSSDVMIHSTVSIANAHIQLIETLVEQLSPEKEVDKDFGGTKDKAEESVISTTRKLVSLKADWIDLLNTCQNRLLQFKPTNNPNKLLLKSISDRIDEAIKRGGWLMVPNHESSSQKKHCNVEELNLCVNKLQLSQTMFKMCEKDLASIPKDQEIEPEIENFIQRISTNQHRIIELLENIKSTRLLIEESQETQIEVCSSTYENTTNQKKLCKIDELKERIRFELQSFDNINSCDDSSTNSGDFQLSQFLADCLNHELAMLDKIGLRNSCDSVSQNTKSLNTNNSTNPSANPSQYTSRFSSPIKLAIYAFAITAVIVGFLYQNNDRRPIFCRPTYRNNNWLRFCENSTFSDDFLPH